MSGVVLLLHGGPAVERDGVRSPHRPPARRQASLALGHLALHRRRPVPREELLDACWPDGPPASAASSLRRVLSDLRQWLQACGARATVESAHGCYSLQLAGDRLDVDDVEALLGQAADAVDEQALEPLRRAERATREVLLPGLQAPWLDDARHRLQERRQRLLEDLSECERRYGDAEAAVAAALEVTDVDPLRESAYRLAMAAHQRAGRPGAALQLYEVCRQRLLEQLGVVPSAETVLLHRVVLGAETGVRAEPPPLRLGTVGPHLHGIHQEEQMVALETQLADGDLRADSAARPRLDLLIDLGRLRWSSRRPASQVLDVALAAGHASLAAGSPDHLAAAADLLAVNTGVGRLSGEIRRLCELALDAWGDRADVRARVLTLLAESDSGQDAVALARRAVSAARECGDPRVLLDALMTLDRSLAWTPLVHERAGLAQECEALLAAGVDRWRVRPTYEPHTRAQTGDTAWLAAQSRDLRVLADRCGQWEPSFYASAYEATTTLLAGDVDRAGALADDLLGMTRDDVNAVNAASGLQMAVLRERGGVAAMLPAIAHVADANPDVGAFRAAHALGLVVEREHAQGREVVRSLLADGLDGVPRDLVWLLCLGALAEAVALLALEAPAPEDDAAADLLLSLLEPYRGQVAAGAHGVVALGTVDAYRGMLLVGRRELPAAVEALQDGTGLAERMGAPLLAARSRAWLARACRTAEPARAAALAVQASRVAGVPGRDGLADAVARLG